MFPCTNPVGGNRPYGKTPGLEVGAPSPQGAFVGNTNKAERYKVFGEDSEERTSRRWTFGSLSGS